MRILLAIFLFLKALLFSVEADFDVAIVGTSPISMLEAIYHLSQNERVLIMEADEKCGGAWKSIDVCGIAGVDLGCHLIGKDQRVKEFFEQFFGCEFVCMQHPFEIADASHAACGNGYYFSKGIHALVSRLESRIHSYSNGTLLHKKLDSIYIDSDQGIVELFLGADHWKASKLVITGRSHFLVKNSTFSNAEGRKRIYPHLYMLIEDEIPFQFTYLAGICPEMSRVMNLTPFLDLPEKNVQMIVVQIHSNQTDYSPEKFFRALIEKNYLSPQAKIRQSEVYVYEQGNINAQALARMSDNLIEVLEASSFSSINRHLDKWKSQLLMEAK